MPEQRKLMEGVHLQPGEPLWQRVPTRGAGGELLNDFMMLIPGIREWPEERRQQALASLQQVLGEQGGKVVFADLNLKLNLLWISMRPGADGCFDSCSISVPGSGSCLGDRDTPQSYSSARRASPYTRSAG